MFWNSLLSMPIVGWTQSGQFLAPPKNGIAFKAIGPEPRLVPVVVLLADELSILHRRRSKSRTEGSAELAGAAETAALNDVL